MTKFKILFVAAGVSVVMCLALFAQEPQGRGGQGASAGGAGAGAGQAVPAVPGAGAQSAPAPGGAAGGRGGRGGGGGGGGGNARGGGGGGGNIQVLQGANIPETMQGFVQALGLLDEGTCAYCHVEDRKSDEKRPKQVARRMITMMRAINGTFGDGQQHVTCYTCHRGETKPLMQPPF